MLNGFILGIITNSCEINHCIRYCKKCIYKTIAENYLAVKNNNINGNGANESINSKKHYDTQSY